MFKYDISKILASSQSRLILFGSRGRGDADEFSDYDFLNITPEQEHGVKEKIEEIEMDMFIKYNAIINSYLFSEEELNKLSFEPFIINALEEGTIV